MALWLLPFAAATAQIPPTAFENVSATDLVAAFQQLCLPEFPDTTAIALKAGSTGWTRMPTPDLPHHFKGLTFEKDHLILTKSGILAEIGPDARDTSKSSCSVSALSDESNLPDLSAQAARSLKLPSTVPSADDNSVEWQFSDGRMLVADILSSKPPMPKGKFARTISIFGPKAAQ